MISLAYLGNNSILFFIRQSDELFLSGKIEQKMDGKYK